MDWIDKLNKELEERRERNKTPEAKEEAQQRARSWIASQGGTFGSKTLIEEKKGLYGRTKEQIKKDSSKAGLISGAKYKGKWLKEYLKNNPEIHSKGGKMGGKKNVESGHLAKLHKQYLESNMQYLDHTQHTCPNCGKTVNGGVYHRWHGDNCKELEKINKQIYILSSLPNIFTSNDVVKICKEKNYNNKFIKYGICKNEKYIEVIKVGTNQSNPSVFKKLYK